MASDNFKLPIEKAHQRHSGAVKNDPEKRRTVAQVMADIRSEGLPADITVEDTAELQLSERRLQADGS